MSIWTFSARALCILTVLAACEAGPSVTRRAPEKVAVANQSVIVAGPPGYCVDTAATRDSATGAFVLLGSCASIIGSARVATPATSALLTASVSPALGTAAVAASDQLAAFFGSDAGRAALARDGRAGSVSVLKMQRRGQALYIQVRDTSAEMAGNLARDYWRGVFDLDGRLVTVSVISFADKPLADAASIATLDAFAARIRAENRAADPDPRLRG